MPTLSYIIPAYNESKTLEEIVQKVLEVKLPEGYQKELIIVNDCSKDATLKIARELESLHPSVKVIDNENNLGKTQSVKKGIMESTGDYVVIQDADLEYDPKDTEFLLVNLLKNNCEVAYGNRFGVDNGMIYAQNFYGNIFISLVSSIFTSYRLKVTIPDMEVCYKMVRGDIIRKIAPTIESTSNFGFEPEITAKLSRFKIEDRNLKFIILPITYIPRTVAEGKKMKAFRDGLKALFEIIKFNLF
jgi:glycosyltransferase involved in cell wall biosynthesis